MQQLQSWLHRARRCTRCTLRVGNRTATKRTRVCTPLQLQEIYMQCSTDGPVRAGSQGWLSTANCHREYLLSKLSGPSRGSTGRGPRSEGKLWEPPRSPPSRFPASRPRQPPWLWPMLRPARGLESDPHYPPATGVTAGPPCVDHGKPPSQRAWCRRSGCEGIDHSPV